MCVLISCLTFFLLMYVITLMFIIGKRISILLKIARITIPHYRNLKKNLYMYIADITTADDFAIRFVIFVIR